MRQRGRRIRCGERPPRRRRSAAGRRTRRRRCRSSTLAFECRERLTEIAYARSVRGRPRRSVRFDIASVSVSSRRAGCQEQRRLHASVAACRYNGHARCCRVVVGTVHLPSLSAQLLRYGKSRSHDRLELVNVRDLKRHLAVHVLANAQRVLELVQSFGKLSAAMEDVTDEIVALAAVRVFVRACSGRRQHLLSRLLAPK
jgi:hypothetical protein